MRVCICLFAAIAVASATWAGGYTSLIKPGIVGYGYTGGYSGLGYGGQAGVTGAPAVVRSVLPGAYGAYSGSFGAGYGLGQGYTAPVGGYGAYGTGYPGFVSAGNTAYMGTSYSLGNSFGYNAFGKSAAPIAYGGYSHGGFGYNGAWKRAHW